MRRLARHSFTLFSAVALLLCVGVCVLWVRGRTGSDAASWRYDRFLPDGSAASKHVHLTSDKRLWLDANWGLVGPFNGQLGWGYYMNADRSGGRPRLGFYHDRYDAMQRWTFFKFDVDDGTTGWGPLRWQGGGRSRPKDGDDSRYIRIGVSHWLLALLLLVPAMLWVKRFRKARRARMHGLCPICGYDLRATPERCPECGAAVLNKAS